MHEHPEEGYDVLHPAGCESETVDWGDGIKSVSYDCDVAWHIDSVGLDNDYIHAFDEVWSSPIVSEPERLLPGIYRTWVEVEEYRCWDCWGGYEYDSFLHAEPQRAITTGPNLVEGIRFRISELKAEYRLGGRTCWSGPLPRLSADAADAILRRARA
jgi:hypothetical protein